jgi:hypothetical protein
LVVEKLSLDKRAAKLDIDSGTDLSAYINVQHNHSRSVRIR